MKIKKQIHQQVKDLKFSLLEKRRIFETEKPQPNAEKTEKTPEENAKFLFQKIALKLKIVLSEEFLEKMIKSDSEKKSLKVGNYEFTFIRTPNDDIGDVRIIMKNKAIIIFDLNILDNNEPIVYILKENGEEIGFYEKYGEHEKAKNLAEVNSAMRTLLLNLNREKTSKKYSTKD